MPNPIPSLVLFGPDKEGALYSLDMNGRRSVLFSSKVNKSKPQLQMYRIVQGGLLHPLGTAAFSSLSGTITIAIHGQEIKMKDISESLQYSKSFPSPVGEMKWKPTGWGNGMELWDSAGVLLARYKYLKLSGDPQLEIFVQLNDYLLDTVVTAAVSIFVDEQRGLKIVSKVFGAVGGL